jgi:hypothetical protein
MSSEPPTSEPVPHDDPWDRAALFLLSGPLAVLIGCACLVLLASWVPHYLAWPYYSDHDAYATLAYGWAHGDLPYRDVLCNNFPGQVYLFWVLGKLVGWGQPIAFYVVDSALLLSFGGLILAWSHRRLGSGLPGLVGYVAFLGYYLGLDYSLTGQRDWHAPFFAVSAILLVQAWPGRLARTLSALGFAMAILVRPQSVVLLPALLATFFVLPTSRERSLSERRTRALLGWFTAWAAFLVLGFAPLLASGVFADFLRGIRHTVPGGGYSQVGIASFVKAALRQLLVLKAWGIALPVAILAVRRRVADDSQARNVAGIWLAALAGAMLIKPLSPSPHLSYLHPVMVVVGVLIAVLVRQVLDLPNLTPSVRLAAVVLVAALCVGDKPRFCSLPRSLAAIKDLRHGQESADAPLGYVTNPGVAFAAAYEWRDYQDLLVYLRQNLGPETRVANALKGCPSITAPARRRTAFPAESVEWVTLVAPEDEVRFIAALEREPDSIVVWDPSEEGKTRLDFRSELAGLTAAIRRLYEPSARFGRIEVWTRRSAAREPALASLHVRSRPD